MTKVRIAIVEDNASNMKLIKTILEHAGYETMTASNADEGILMIRSEKPDLVLMDIHMPGTDGLVATRLLKSEAETKHIPVIAVTAKVMDSDRKSILSAGCDGYVSKPIRYKQMLELIAEFMG